jgi:hypothetical protein
MVPRDEIVFSFIVISLLNLYINDEYLLSAKN